MMFPKLADVLSSGGHASLAGPLQRSKIPTDNGTDQEDDRNNRATDGQKEVDPHGSTVGIIISILKCTCNDADNNRHPKAIG